MQTMQPFLEEVGCTKDQNICLVSMVLICIVTLLVIPFSVHTTYKLYFYRRDQGLVRRYPTTLVLSSTLNILYMFIVIQYKIIDSGISQNRKLKLWWSNVVANPYLLLIILINIFRIWLIAYDINISVIQSRHSWQSLLCTTVNDDGWYSRNRQKWGNWRWLIKIFVILWLFLSILCTTPSLLHYIISFEIYENTADIIFSGMVIILLLFSVGIWYKMPHFEDTFHILKEIKILITASVLLCVIWFSLIFWVEHGNIFDIIQISIIFLFVFIQIFISEYLVMNMLRKINDQTKDNSSRVSNCTYPIRNRTLFHVLIESDIGIEEYVKHLLHEFCTENVLFFIEIIQWIYLVTNKELDKYDISPLSLHSLEYTFSKMIPISSINSDKKATWDIKIDLIYKKYVSSSAEWEVNLPYKIRTEFAQLLRLYKMKQDMENNTYKPTYIKTKPSKSHRKRSSSTGKFLTHSSSFWKESKSRLFSIRTKRKKPSVINEDKATKIDGNETPIADHLRYSKSLQAYNRNKQVKFAESALRKTKSVDTVSPNNDLEKRESQHNKKNFSLTITKIDEEQDHTVVTKTHDTIGDIGSQQTMIEREVGHSHDTMELESIYNDLVEHETTPPPVLHTAIVSATPDNISSMATSVPSMSEHDQDIDDNEIETNDVGTTANIEEKEPVESVENGMDKNKRMLSEIKEEEKFSPSLPPEEEPDLDHMDSKLGAFLDDVLDAAHTQLDGGKSDGVLEIDITSFGSESQHTKAALSNTSNTLGAEPVPMDPTDSHLFSASSLMATEDYNYNVKTHLSTKRRSGITSMGFKNISKAFSSLGVFTLRSTSRQTSTFVDDEDQWEIDPKEQKEMDMAKTINLTHFITIACYALNEVLQLNYQSISRFRKTKYFQTFDDKINLEPLLKEVEINFKTEH